ncbi:MAG: thioredoxin family protein [Thermoguttaceae bacterium]|nr:thioredoxin family protein [Thermoguttaceae bacterium]MDW8079641.1 thioredoxin family protein [Thermoguttaceae bacterium]
MTARIAGPRRSRILSRSIFPASLLVTVYAFLCSPVRSADPPPGPWLSDVTTAQRRAATSGKLILIHFWSSRCQPCRFMNDRVLTNPQVVQYLSENFEPVKVNVEQFPYTAKQFGVNAVPTCVILSPSGEVLQRWVGATDTQRYLQQLAQVNHQWRTRAAQVATAPPPAVQPSPGPQRPSPAAGIYPPESYLAGQPTGTSPQASPVPTRAEGPPSHQPPGSGTNPRAIDAVAASPPNPAPTNQLAGGPFPAQPVPQAVQSEGVPSPAGATGAIPAAPPATAPKPPDAGGLTGGTGQNLPQPGEVASGFPTGRRADTSAAGTPGINPGGAQPARPLETNNSGFLSGLPPLGLDGFCPVSVTELGRWVPGNPQWGLIHEGRLYLFAGPAEQAKFASDPQRFAPVLSGYDVVLAVDKGVLVPGRREFGGWYQGRMYLFANEETLRRFDAEPQRYTAAVAARSPASPPDTLRLGTPNPARTSW